MGACAETANSVVSLRGIKSEQPVNDRLQFYHLFSDLD